MSSVSFFAFIMLMIFPYLKLYLGVHGCMFVFAVVSAFGVPYTIYIVPETKGKNLDVLERASDSPTTTATATTFNTKL